MDGGNTLMTPNLRLNSHLTNRMNKYHIPPEEKMTEYSINWQLENGNHILGWYYPSLFNVTIMHLIKNEDGLYRLFCTDKDGGTGIYMIDDIELFIDKVGICMLDTKTEFAQEFRERWKAILDKVNQEPSSGVISIDEDGRVYVYEHYDY